LDKVLHKLFSLPKEFNGSLPVRKSDFPRDFFEVILKDLQQHISVPVSQFDLGHLSPPPFDPSQFKYKVEGLAEQEVKPMASRGQFYHLSGVLNWP
jgi:hypothetical protein